MTRKPSAGPRPVLQFRNPISSRHDCLEGGSTRHKASATHTVTRTQNKHIQTSTLRVGLEPMNPVFKRANTVHALDRVATVNGLATAFCLSVCLSIYLSLSLSLSARVCACVRACVRVRGG
jgi:hypothetical protein